MSQVLRAGGGTRPDASVHRLGRPSEEIARRFPDRLRLGTPPPPAGQDAARRAAAERQKLLPRAPPGTRRQDARHAPSHRPPTGRHSRGAASRRWRRLCSRHFGGHLRHRHCHSHTAPHCTGGSRRRMLGTNSLLPVSRRLPSRPRPAGLSRTPNELDVWSYTPTFARRCTRVGLADGSWLEGSATPPPLARVVRWPRPHHARRRLLAFDFAQTDTLTADVVVRWSRQVPRSSAGGRTGPLSMGPGGLGQQTRYVCWPRHVGGQGSRIVPFASARFDTSSCLKSSTGHGGDRATEPSRRCRCGTAGYFGGQAPPRFLPQRSPNCPPSCQRAHRAGGAQRPADHPSAMPCSRPATAHRTPQAGARFGGGASALTPGRNCQAGSRGRWTSRPR